MILVAGVGVAAAIASVEDWRHATQADSGIERLIETDREFFRSMQPVWDDYEANRPGWIRPQPTTEEQYRQWREHYQERPPGEKSVP